MALNIKNTKSAKEQPINVIVYAESGVGKTSLARHLPEKSALILSAENGLLSVNGCDIDYIDVKNVKEIVKMIPEIAKLDNKTVFIDSITELSQNHYTLLKKKYTQLEKDEDKKPGAYSMAVWGEFLEDFSAMFKGFRDINKNVVALALLKVKENDDGSINKMPDIFGKTAERIVAWFDECFYMYVDKEGKRMFLTDKANNYVAKDRSSKLDKTEVANLLEVFKKIRA